MSSIFRRHLAKAAASLVAPASRSAALVQGATPVRLAFAVRSYSTPAASSTPLKSNISTSSSAVVSSTKDLIIQGKRIVAGAVLSRQPLILRDLSPFEQEYFTYQKNLERDHAAPFGSEFYFKKGSVAERRWKQQEADRLAAGSSSTSTSTLSSSSKDASSKATEESSQLQDEISEEDRVAALEAQIQFNDRVTEADRKKDMRSLERALARTLYLIVKKPREQHAWQFPQGGVRLVENLQEAAGRELQEECGSNMDLWFVGRVPIGHYSYNFPKELKSESVKGAKVFFMKAHIFAGQVQVDNKEIVDYAWVTKQEMKDYVAPEYYEAVQDMLSDF
ncbi:large subunit ribosomal protein L46 [Entomortierella parvispora]|uniref:Large ribosomal subunit protein mL46 n=1 Tax=Entomortierella parvispora TaxID=205924 RepID=A0A9P3HEZ4_9FUNG|nr:large subunit ribosomal protein L46 [Entomortierella parvispora]